MAYDRGLEERLCEYFQGRPDLDIRKMFGGLCFLLSEHMCCVIVGDELMVRVGPKDYEKYLAKPYAREMDFTGKPIKTMVYVASAGLESDEELNGWLSVCMSFAESLPPKRPKLKNSQ
ncbi:TfoX/Sxy family protein [Marinomonas flavescens]|uniref:TfoX/Sxy family protein n=1 Tax=Marinomonas flavescens TaxID=2529379 RepID=UPI001056C31A|nr:TfoX/Sxy family protein [Marinomonas flavescens]